MAESANVGSTQQASRPQRANSKASAAEIIARHAWSRPIAPAATLGPQGPGVSPSPVTGNWRHGSSSQAAPRFSALYEISFTGVAKSHDPLSIDVGIVGIGNIRHHNKAHSGHRHRARTGLITAVRRHGHPCRGQGLHHGVGRHARIRTRCFQTGVRRRSVTSPRYSDNSRAG